MFPPVVCSIIVPPRLRVEGLPRAALSAIIGGGLAHVHWPSGDEIVDRTRYMVLFFEGNTSGLAQNSRKAKMS
jgi:hypothetical protein